MSQLKDVEIELKFPLLNHKAVSQRLACLATPKKKNDVQKDTYFVPLNRNFLAKNPVSEWLRIRETNRSCTINYKHWHNEKNKKTIVCDEFETGIENPETLKKILVSLDFKEIVIVEKRRNTWEHKGVNIAIDEVKDLGFFIEVETKGSLSNITKAKQGLYSVLADVGAETGEQDFEGYPYLILKKKKLVK